MTTLGKITPVKKTPRQIMEERAHGLEGGVRRTHKPIAPPTFTIEEPPFSISRFIRNYPVLVILLLANILYGVYLLGIAAPQYESEAHFVLKTDQKSSGGGGAAAAMSGGSGGGDQQSTQAVLDYMKSRDAMKNLQRWGLLNGVFNNSKADFMTRWPNWYTKDTKEKFYQYYKKHIQADINGATSLPVLKVRTFNSHDSYMIAKALLYAADTMINRANVRLRQDTIAAAQKEFEADLVRMRNVQVRLSLFRDANNIIDPDKQSQNMIGNEYALKSILQATEMKLKQTMITSPNSPVIEVYERQVESLKEQLRNSSRGLTGDQTSLVPKLKEYDTLLVEKQLFDKVLQTEITSLEQARAQADRHMIFLEDITEPSEPDSKSYPKTYKFLFTSILASMGLYFMYRIFAAGAKEHES